MSLNRRVPLYYLIILTAAFGVTIYFYQTKKQYEVSKLLEPLPGNQPPGKSSRIERLSGYKYIAPLPSELPGTKSNKFSNLNDKIAGHVNELQNAGIINTASFYLQDIQTSDWTGYNEDEKYFPGSLMKVPELISVLRYQEEEKSDLLDEKVFYPAPFVVEKHTRFTSIQLQPGNSYTVKELLKYMIAYSDNNATILLDQHLDQRVFTKLLTDLGLPLPQKDAVNYPISAREFSSFYRTIYNSSYLSVSHSEYAAELLSNSDFPEGFAKAFPPNQKMIQKFGEAGNQFEHQLHESGIVYVNDKPYILTVMTKGKDLEKLPCIRNSLHCLSRYFQIIRSSLIPALQKICSKLFPMAAIQIPFQ